MKHLIRNFAQMLMLMITLAIPSSAQPPATSDPFAPVTKMQGNLVNIRVQAAFDAPGGPFLGFIDALKTYPQARQFRVSWTLTVFSNGASTTVLYDRGKHTLWLYSIGSGDVSGDFQDWVRYTGVREGVFEKIARRHKDDIEGLGAWSWFGDLPKYGCRKCDLGSWQRPRRNYSGRRRRASMATSSRRTLAANLVTAS